MFLFCLYLKKPPRKGIAERDSAIPSEGFPGGKVKHFRRKCEVLLTQCEVCPGHEKVSLCDEYKNYGRHPSDVVHSLSFSKKILHCVSFFSHRQVCFTDLHRKSTSLRVGHIPMRNPLKGEALENRIRLICVTPHTWGSGTAALRCLRHPERCPRGIHRPPAPGSGRHPEPGRRIHHRPPCPRSSS